MKLPGVRGTCTSCFRFETHTYAIQYVIFLSSSFATDDANADDDQLPNLPLEVAHPKKVKKCDEPWLPLSKQMRYLAKLSICIRA